MPYELPPDYEERKRKLLVAKGFDPLVDDIDLDTMSVVPRQDKPAGRFEAIGKSAAYNLPETASSLVGARGGATLVSGLASLLRKAPHPALKILGTVGGALATPALTSRFTQPIKEAVSPGITQEMETMRLDRPWEVVSGAQLSALPFMRFGNPLKAGLPNVAAGAAIGAGVPLAQQMQKHENIGDIDLREVVSGGVGGVFLNKPTRLGTKLSGIQPTIIQDTTKPPVAKPVAPTVSYNEDNFKAAEMSGIGKYKNATELQGALDPFIDLSKNSDKANKKLKTELQSEINAIKSSYELLPLEQRVEADKNIADLQDKLARFDQFDKYQIALETLKKNKIQATGSRDIETTPFDTGEQRFEETGFEGWKPPVEKPLPLKQPQESADWETQGGEYEQPSATAPKPIQVDTTKVGTPENKLGGPENWKDETPINFRERGLPPEAQESIADYNEDAKTMYSGFPGFGGQRRVKSNYGPQDEPQITPRAGWNPFKSEVDKLRAGGTQQAEMADATDTLFNKRRELSGRYANPVIGAFEKLSPEKQQKVYGILIEEDRQNRDLWQSLAPDEQAAYHEYRRVNNGMMPDDQIAAGQLVNQSNGLHRQRGKRKHYTSNIEDRAVRRIISQGQGSPQFQKLKKDFIQWQTQHGVSNVEAEKRFARRQGNLKSAFNDDKFSFDAVDEPEGIGLPDSWLERDPIQAFKTYANRFAKARAFYDVVKTNPRLMRMLGSDTYGNGVSIPQNIQTENLTTDEQVRNILNNYSGADQGGQEPVITGIGRVVNAAILSGPITKLTDIGTVPFKALAYVPAGHESAIVKGIADWRQGYKDAFDQGFNRRGGQVVMQDMLGIGEKAADAMSQVAETITKITGSEQLELVSRGLSQAIGNFIAEAHVGLAKQGNAKSIKFLEKLGKDWQTQSPKELGTRIGQLLQGRYDITNLPRWAIDSPYAPFLGMMKWSIEQTNNFIKYVVEPARKDGDFGPFIKTIIGGVGGGLVLNEMREQLSGKKPYTATWKELEAGEGKPGYADALTYKMIGAAQVTGTAGILMEILRQTYEEATGRMPQGFRYPVYEVGKDTLQRMFAATKAIAEGEDTEKVTVALTKDLLTRHVQMARIIKNQLGKSGEWKDAKDDIDRSNMMRDEDTYNRMMNKPQAAKVQTPPSYSRLTEKEFDKEEDLGKAAKLVPGLVRRGVERAGGDPATLSSEMRKLATIDTRGMPSPDRDPIGFAKYYNWLRETQGDEKARQFTSEFMKRRALAETKRGMIPKIKAQ